MGDCAFTWNSKKKLIVTLSTCKVEYVTTTSCKCQVIWLRRLFKEFNMNQERFILIINSPNNHIDTRYHFIKECVVKKKVELVHVKTQYQVKDIFTKSVKFEDFRSLRARFCVPNKTSQPIKEEPRSGRSYPSQINSFLDRPTMQPSSQRAAKTASQSGSPSAMPHQPNPAQLQCHSRRSLQLMLLEGTAWRSQHTLVDQILSILAIIGEPSSSVHRDRYGRRNPLNSCPDDRNRFNNYSRSSSNPLYDLDPEIEITLRRLRKARNTEASSSNSSNFASNYDTNISATNDSDFCENSSANNFVEPEQMENND
ncbi:hypothetical protein CR513_30379, partial [Mucuna pruriens]